MKILDYDALADKAHKYDAKAHLSKRSGRALKRFFDLVIASIAGVLSLPLVLLSIIGIKTFSPGPAFFTQERIGFRGKRIKVWKLRTMHLNAQELLEQHLASDPAAKCEWEQYFKLRNDPRIILVIGNFLRKSSMDELPQLWNVLKGDMSLVGPRPFPEYHLNVFSKEFQFLRAQVVPGLTGLWQVSARSEGDTKVQESLDRQYIAKWSFWLDMKIIAKTAKVVLLQRGAY